MEYKLYLQHKRIIPTATKRRWSDSQKGFRKHYKTWLQDPMHQDATSNCEEESSSHCNKPPHHSTDDTSESEEENSSQCNKPPHHFTDDTSESEEEEWDELNTTLHHNMQGESDNENEQNWHMTPPKDPTVSTSEMSTSVYTVLTFIFCLLTSLTIIFLSCLSILKQTLTLLFNCVIV
ncbi:uncharacterized protein [Misgurnus anguillicaudatus]|uniref:uncharacterized protein isoform X3 n=1 Tax=Misgurnus anguillicaudatus TaxID=75329 RepID=UPI003CCF5005